ncbi:MAG: SusD/RagB family nutrient-binding outer membrane lipoprotein [Ferruginibacter sp.]
MKKIIWLLLLTTSLGGCKKFIDVNKDPNNPVDVQESLLLSPLEVNIASVVSSLGTVPIHVNHFMQNIALNQPVPNTGTYTVVNAEMDGDWSNLYVTCLNNLRILNTKAETDGLPNYSGIAKVLTAYCLGTATDLWGDIPYTSALQGSTEFLPVYDKQEDIYTTVQSMLDNAIADIDKNTGQVPGGDDFFYGGDMSKWKKLAYTLKARYFLHLTKAPGHTAAAQADLALTALQNAMLSNDDDLKFSYTGAAGQENPYYQLFLPISTVVLSSNLVDSLVARNDPRLSKLVAPALQTGLYNGRVIGSVNVGSLEEYSLGGPAYADAASVHFIVNYSEALFIKAEASLIKSGVSAAQDVYTDAVKSHMGKLGIATADVTAYLSSRGTLTSENALQRIIEEKNIANYLSLENYNDWRRTGFPILTKVPNAASDIPRRMLYPQVEILSNPQPQQTAKLTDRVWWDK